MFLTGAKGYTLSSSEQDVFMTSDYYVRRGDSVGIEVALDLRDEAVWVYLLRLHDNGLPPHGFVDVEKGERIRVSLLTVLKRFLGVKDAQLDELAAMLNAPQAIRTRDYSWASEALTRWSDLVELYIDEVSHEPIAVLFPPPPPDASPASQA
jgi:hypothetical protein